MCSSEAEVLLAGAVLHQSWADTAGTAAPPHLLMDSYQFNVQHLTS